MIIMTPPDSSLTPSVSQVLPGGVALGHLSAVVRGFLPEILIEHPVLAQLLHSVPTAVTSGPFPGLELC